MKNNAQAKLTAEIKRNEIYRGAWFSAAQNQVSGPAWSNAKRQLKRSDKRLAALRMEVK